MAWALDNALVRITDANGDSINGAKLFIFAAGTTTPSTIYSNNALGTTHSNPVVADSGGLIAECWLAAGSYKLRYTGAIGDGTDTIQEIDNYVVPDITAQNSLPPLPVTAKTSDYTILDTDDGAVIAVDASSAPGSLVTINADGGTLGNGFSFWVVNTGATGTATIVPDTGSGETINGGSSYSVATQFEAVQLVSRGAAGFYVVATHQPAVTGTKGTDVASASPLVLGAGTFFHITGSTSFTDIDFSSPQNGRHAILEFDGALTITHNATTLSLPGGANVVTAAGTRMALVQDSSDNVHVLWVTHATNIATQAQMETGTETGHYQVVPGRVQYHPGVAKFWAKATGNSTTVLASHNLTSWADTGTGVADATIATDFSGVNWCAISDTENTDASIDDASDCQHSMIALGGQAAGTLKLTAANGGGGAAVDPTSWYVAGWGDQS